jgi:membrane-associated phospholipid phosphatase
MRLTFLFLLAILLLPSKAGGQLFESDVYNVNPYIDGAITAAAFGMNYWGLMIVDRKGRLDSTQINRLDPMDINAFDRSATRQDASYMKQAWKVSDVGMRGSFLLPALLMLDREIRQDWAPVLLMYFETEAIVGCLFSWGAAIHIDRIRPLVYHPDVSYGDKIFKRNKNSFYSGHTSSSAAASFYVAKVYCDYHPELGNKKYIFYSLALIPPTFTGFFRYKGMKHYPTDVLTGIAVGAATGILVPHLHKHKNQNLVIVPYTGQYNGFAMTLKF